MSLSKESQEYHLTPRGWEEGSFIGDAVGGKNIKDTPTDRVLTIKCYEKLTHPMGKMDFYDGTSWKSKDEDSINKLKKKYGEKPDWYGYEKM